ncbi:uncharacterized protein LOC128896415 [Hylaeus anthracinus]|uniref:uncharacterized protein LOC128896415 n=1 Tax=Hylaeus anthracinus TaxID=313031 RepID=UPI0023B89753|nr:uncharacterized protein LOC128896415 [Hylaeus anthracinus]
MNGIPQGSVISLPLFLIAINDITQVIKKPGKCFPFADDLTIMFTGKKIKQTEKLAQQALDNLYKWPLTSGFKFSEEKTSYMIINRPSYSGITPSLYLNNQQINMELQQKILGLIFDIKLNWELHIKKVKANCQQRIKIIKTLASKSWGANSEIILRTYKAIIRPVLDYGAPIYGSAPKRLLKILDPIQTTSLRLSLGAFKTSPNSSVIVETGEIPLEYRRRQLSLALAATIYSNQRNPCYETLITHNNQQIYISRNTLPKPFSIRQARYASDWNLTIPQITQRLPALTPPGKLNNPNINFELSNLNKKETSAIIYQSRFSEIANKYRNHKHIYTDGSINKEQGGCAIITDNQELTKEFQFNFHMSSVRNLTGLTIHKILRTQSVCYIYRLQISSTCYGRPYKYNKNNSRYPRRINKTSIRKKCSTRIYLDSITPRNRRQRKSR